MQISNETLIKFGLPSPSRPASDLFNRELQREESYNLDNLNIFVQTHTPKLLLEQRIAYDSVMRAVAAEQRRFLLFGCSWRNRQNIFNCS